MTIFQTLKFLVQKYELLVKKVVHSEPATSKPVTTGPETIKPATSSEQAIEVKIEEAEKTQIIDLEEGDPEIIKIKVLLIFKFKKLYFSFRQSFKIPEKRKPNRLR